LFSTINIADGLTDFRVKASEGTAGAFEFFLKPKRKDKMKKKKFGRGSPNMLLTMKSKMRRQSVRV